MIFEHIRENEKETSFFPVGCIFKSFLSVLVVIALYEGKIGSIDDCVIDYKCGLEFAIVRPQF